MLAIQSLPFFPCHIYHSSQDLERQNHQYKLISKIALGIITGILCVPINQHISFVVTGILGYFGIELIAQQDCIKHLNKTRNYPLIHNFFLLYICLLGPIIEEIGFRGVLESTLKKYLINPNDITSKIARIIIPSLLFGAAHLSVSQGYTNIAIFSTAVLLGIAFQLLKAETGDLVAPCAAHITHNTTALAYIFYFS